MAFFFSTLSSSFLWKFWYKFILLLQSEFYSDALNVLYIAIILMLGIICNLSSRTNVKINRFHLKYICCLYEYYVDTWTITVNIPECFGIDFFVSNVVWSTWCWLGVTRNASAASDTKCCHTKLIPIAGDVFDIICSIFVKQIKSTFY